jgi:intracellular sulfur oxidation DsrE/DsrF family protein
MSNPFARESWSPYLVGTGIGVLSWFAVASADRSSYAVPSGVQSNPNLKLIERLSEVGVEIFVCAQALAHRGYSTEEVASSVKVAFSAATVSINQQTAGYAYLPFH